MYQGGKFDLPTMICLPALLIDVIYLHPRLFGQRSVILKRRINTLGPIFALSEQG
jgi:hypothetical protein